MHLRFFSSLFLAADICTPVRIKGIVSTCELVHCTDVDIVLQGAVPVVQIDLSRNVRVHLPKKEMGPRPKIVNASNTLLSVVYADGSTEDVPSSMFGEQFVSFWTRGHDDKWVFVSQTTDKLKQGGYVELAGVSGSNVSLLDLEDAASGGHRKDQ